MAERQYSARKDMMMDYEVRFWDGYECVKVGGKYYHYCDTIKEAWECAKALAPNALKNGADTMSISSNREMKFYTIEA